MRFPAWGNILQIPFGMLAEKVRDKRILCIIGIPGPHELGPHRRFTVLIYARETHGCSDRLLPCALSLLTWEEIGLDRSAGWNCTVRGKY